MVQTAQQALEPLFQRQVADGGADRMSPPFAVEVEPVTGVTGKTGKNITQGFIVDRQADQRVGGYFCATAG
jgi:hypothetical protein